MLRKAALGSVLIVLALAFLWWTRFTRDQEPSRVEAPTPDSERNVPVSLSDAGDVGTSGSLESSSAEPSATREPAPPDPSATTELQGRVIVLDASGAEHDSEDGFFQLWADEEEHRVDVKQGRWTTRIPSKCQTVAIPRMELAHRMALSEEIGTMPIHLNRGH